MNYTYDAAGHVASITSSNANGASMAYTYDDLNRLSTVVDSRLGTTTYAYDPANNVTTATYPNSFQSIYTYDELNRLTAQASQVSGYTYQLGPTGNRTSASEYSGRQVTWSYDGIYRLTNESITGASGGKNGNVAYGLDPVGNRLSETSSLSGVPSGSFGYNADDEVSTESYDQDGNTLATGGKTFAYDSQNHMVSMGSTVALVYDGDGNRVAKTVSGVTTRYLVDDLNPTGYPQVIDELTGATVTRTYTYGLQRISQDQVISNTWTPSFYGYDGGGNVRQLTNSAGAITDTYDYDAFGNKVNSTGTTPNNYLYRGEQFDPDLGLYYLRARYYNPITGRFMGRDPEDGDYSDPATLHKYVYAGGDPVNLADPTGRAQAATTTWGGAGGEYAGLTSIVSLGAQVGEVAVAVAVSCVLDTAASLLKGVTTHLGAPVVGISFDPGSCSAKVKKCLPCDLPVDSTGYRIDEEDEGPHFDKPTQQWLEGTHWHLFEMQQRRDNCVCQWKKLGPAFDTFPPFAEYDITKTPASGGGIAEY